MSHYEIRSGEETDCAYCGWPFDVGDSAWEAEDQAFCSRACELLLERMAADWSDGDQPEEPDTRAPGREVWYGWPSMGTGFWGPE